LEVVFFLGGRGRVCKERGGRILCCYEGDDTRVWV
jgi:hypothetical protein